MRPALAVAALLLAAGGGAGFATGVAAQAQGRAATGSGGVLGSVAELQATIETEWASGDSGRIAKGAIGLIGLGYALRYGAVGAFEAIAPENRIPTFRAGVRIDGRGNVRGAGDDGPIGGIDGTPSTLAPVATR